MPQGNQQYYDAGPKAMLAMGRRVVRIDGVTSFLAGRRFGPLDLLLYAVGVAGLCACLTVIWLSMRAVMNVGGFCAEGGPYVIETPCPEGVPLLLTLGIFGLFLFGGLTVWKGALMGGPYGFLVGLAWPALFLSLGWNFLEYAFNPPGPPGQGIVWGWLIPGAVFIVMGAVPVLAVLPIGQSGRSGRARAGVARRVAPRPSVSDVRPTSSGAAGDDLASKLERLAALRRSGDLTRDEFDAAKQALIYEARGS